MQISVCGGGGIFFIYLGVDLVDSSKVIEILQEDRGLDDLGERRVGGLEDSLQVGHDLDLVT